MPTHTISSRPRVQSISWTHQRHHLACLLPAIPSYSAFFPTGNSGISPHCACPGSLSTLLFSHASDSPSWSPVACSLYNRTRPSVPSLSTPAICNTHVILLSDIKLPPPLLHPQLLLLGHSVHLLVSVVVARLCELGESPGGGDDRCDEGESKECKGMFPEGELELGTAR